MGSFRVSCQPRRGAAPGPACLLPIVVSQETGHDPRLDHPAESARLANRLTELAAWRDRATLPLALHFRWSGGEQLLREGEGWPARELPVTLSARTQTARRLARSAGGARPLGGRRGIADSRRRRPWRPQSLPRRSLAERTEMQVLNLDLNIEAVPRGLFGTPNYAPRLERARLLLPRPAGARPARRSDGGPRRGRAAGRCGRGEIADLIADALGEVFTPFRFRAATAQATWRALAGTRAARRLSGLWDEWSFPGACPRRTPTPTARRWTGPGKTWPRAGRHPGTRYPAEGRLALSGHAHIDLAWLWPLAETRRKIRRTFSTVLSPDGALSRLHLQPVLGADLPLIEQDDPGAVRARRRAGARRAAGTWWAACGSSPTAI